MPSSRRSSSRIGGEGGGGRARKGHSLSLSHHIGERLDAQKERPGAATAGNRWSEPPRCVSQHIFCIAGHHPRLSFSLSLSVSLSLTTNLSHSLCASLCLSPALLLPACPGVLSKRNVLAARGEAQSWI